MKCSRPTTGMKQPDYMAYLSSSLNVLKQLLKTDLFALGFYLFAIFSGGYRNRRNMAASGDRTHLRNWKHITNSITETRETTYLLQQLSLSLQTGNAMSFQQPASRCKPFFSNVFQSPRLCACGPKKFIIFQSNFYITVINLLSLINQYQYYYYDYYCCGPLLFRRRYDRIRQKSFTWTRKLEN